MKSPLRLLLGSLVALVLVGGLLVLNFRTPGTPPTAAESAAAEPASPASPPSSTTTEAATLPTPVPTAPDQSATDTAPSPTDADPTLPAALAEVLNALPPVPLRDQIRELELPAQRRVLRKLSELPIPAEDYASLRVAPDGTLYYANDMPPPPAPDAPTLATLRAVATDNADAPRALTGAAAVPIATPPAYHSRPGSTNVIYLDFNGHTITGTNWNTGSNAATYVGKPYDTDDDPTTFSDAEQADIFDIWQRVAEDYAAWDVDVTTEEPAAFTPTTARALITENVDANGENMPSSTAGGVAKLDVFGEPNFATANSPAFVYFNNFSNNSANIAEAVSHEIGHNFGLTHDGQPGVEYYGGHGTGDTSWGPIMGTGYGRNVSQFSKGDYFNANNSQDDFAQITGHVAYATDEAGGTPGTAAAASVSGSDVSLTGVLSSEADVDVFAITTASGSISFAVDGFRAATRTHGGNTDFKLELLDAGGSVVATHAPAGDTNASLTYEATAGDYFIRLSADGDGSPLADPPTGYTAYGSAGQYTLTGTIIAAAPGITSETTASVDAGAPFSYAIVATNAPSAYGATGLPAGLSVDPDTGLISGRATTAGTFNVTLSATNSLGTGSGALTLTVNDAAPAITAQTTSRLVLAPGADQSLSVTAISANGTPTYQWEYNGVTINGATNATLNLTAVAGATSGFYRVRVTNAIGTTLSDPIFVRVAPAATEVRVWGDDGQGMGTIPSGLDDAVELSLGYEFAAAVRADGSLIAWGSDSSGQATAPTGVTDAVHVAAGGFHALALHADGTVTGWGNDFHDQATPPSGLTGVVAIAAGGDASLALKNDGTVVAWGRSEYGQTTVPDGLTDVIAIAAGNFHALALKSDGTVVAWGDNTNGQSTVPPEATGIIAIGAGYGYSVALKADGTLLTWGTSSFGLTNVPNDAAPFAAIEAGPYHAAALNASGELYTWGYSNDGQRLLPVDLGPVFAASASWSNTGIIRDAALQAGPDITSQSATRQTFATGETLSLNVAATGTGTLSYQWYRNSVPLAGATTDTYTQTGATLTDAGVYWATVTDDLGTRRSDPIHMLFAPAASEVMAWGLNTSGQTTVPANLDDAIAVAAGLTHALALKADGTVVAWGDDTDGEATVPEGLTDVVRVVAGEGVSYALKSDGTVAVWGADNFGGGAPPVGLDGVIDLDIQRYHAIALRVDGTVVAWGNNGSGQRDVPFDLAPAVDVAVAANTSFALHADGSITGWGFDGNREIIDIPTGVDATALSGGYYHALARLADGTVAGWGFGEFFNLSGSLTNVIALDAGEELSLALHADRSVTAWGSSDNAAGERTVPGGLDKVFAVAAGTSFGLALQEVEVPTAPSITAHPADLTVTAPAAATFTVAALGVPTPTVQWRKDGTDIPGATDSTLTIDPTTPADSGSYDVVVTNSEGAVTSDAATLTVQFTPEITTQPQSQTVLAGADVAFSVVVTGVPTPTYQWRKDGADIDGATGDSLMLNAVSLSDAAAYDVVITNTVGSVTSDAATLTVNEAPAISTPPQSQTVTAGAAVTFTVTATGSPAPTYQWRKDGENIPDATAASFTIASTTPEDAGSYDVVVSNTVNNATSAAALLTVQYAPQISAQPQAQTVTVGTAVTLSVTATGVPTPTYQWRKDGAVIDGATGPSLDLGTVALDDAGDYDVVVSNSVGDTPSATATLTVREAPAITVQPAAQTTVLTGTDVTLGVTATGTPAPTYQWRKDGVDLSDATASSLTLTAATLDDAATYSVVVSNVAGEATSADAVVSVIEISGTQATDGYTAGETVTITNTVTYAGPVTSLMWSVMPPAAIEGSAWSFVSTTGDVGGVVPTAGDVDVLDWSWSTLPASPFSFTYDLNVPAAAVGGYDLTTQLTVNGSLLAMATPDPLTLAEPVTAHSGDSNQDMTIDLSELLRVIELYNTRSGTQRTGAYAVDAQTEDGFTPDTSRAVDSPATLTAYHSADSDQDSFVSLSELLRVIELYNTRSGTTRTGEYHIDPSTEDGFAPGPAL